MWSPEAITIACLAAAKPYMHGVTWLEFTVNVQDLELHPETGTISPWYCERFDNGVVLNHLISLDVSTMDMDVVLAGFTCQDFDNKRQKEFEKFFPKYDKAEHLYDYYDTVLRHCQATTSLSHCCIPLFRLMIWDSGMSICQPTFSLNA
jgi:hypothetical protein